MKRMFLSVVVLLSVVMAGCTMTLPGMVEVRLAPLVVVEPFPVVPYYAGPYWVDGSRYWYWGGGFYFYSGGVYHFHHYALPAYLPHYDRQWRKHYERHSYHK